MTQVLILGLATFLILSCSPHQDSREAAFWRWFQTNEATLFDFEKDQEHIFDELQEHLHKVHPDLTFEFGPKQDGKREFVITADGLKEGFPAVIALADAAPVLPRWKVTKFRPRRNFQSPVSLNGLKISPHQVQFTIQPDGEKVGITLFIEGYNPAEHARYAGVVYLMLDQALGEFDVETKVGSIEFRDNSAASQLPKKPFSGLPQSFDAMIKHGSKK
jgi:hypothetical protein